MAKPPTSSEKTFREHFARQGLRATRWSNNPRAVYPIHKHPYRKFLAVLSGGITFTVEGPKRVVIALKPGDQLEIPPRTPHSARVGPKGVACLEAQADAAG